MKDSDAVEVVGLLTAAFPNLTLEPDAARLWSRLIAELDDARIAAEVALGFARHSTTYPTIAGFRDAYYRRVKDANDKHARDYGLPEPGSTRRLPEEVVAWMSGHSLRTP